MSAMQFIDAAVGTIVGLAGLFLTWHASPFGQRRRDRKAAAIREVEEDRRLRRETHEALYGSPEERDDSGAVIVEAEPGLMAWRRLITSSHIELLKRTASPLLNGEGEQLVKDVAELKDDMATLKAHLRIPEQRQRD